MVVDDFFQNYTRIKSLRFLSLAINEDNLLYELYSYISITEQSLY